MTKNEKALREALASLRAYLKKWDPEQLSGVFPPQARRLLTMVQEVDQKLLELERAL